MLLCLGALALRNEVFRRGSVNTNGVKGTEEPLVLKLFKYLIKYLKR
jgi:hypothetical protein